MTPLPPARFQGVLLLWEEKGREKKRGKAEDRERERAKGRKKGGRKRKGKGKDDEAPQLKFLTTSLRCGFLKHDSTYVRSA